MLIYMLKTMLITKGALPAQLRIKNEPPVKTRGVVHTLHMRKILF